METVGEVKELVTELLDLRLGGDGLYAEKDVGLLPFDTVEEGGVESGAFDGGIFVGAMSSGLGGGCHGAVSSTARRRLCRTMSRTMGSIVVSR